MTGTNSLHLSKLGKRYGKVDVLSDVTLNVAAGEVIAILGQSGAGKSTLLRLVAGLEAPSSGTIFSGAKRLSDPHSVIAPEKRGVGLIFQDFALFPNMTVLENTGFGRQKTDRQTRNHEAMRWLEPLGMAHRLNAYPHQLSGGEQQRVAIARALTANPAALMMDEPFSGLDPSNRDTVRDAALGAIREAGLPALMVTHDPAEALAHSDRIAVLEHGHLLQCETPDAIYLSPASLDVARAFGPLGAVDAQALSPAWRPLMPADKGLIYYRPDAFRLSDEPHAVEARIVSCRRTGSQHECRLILPGETPITATFLFDTPPSMQQSLRIIPRPELFYAF